MPVTDFDLSALAQAQLAELRSSLKWLAAAAGAVAAALIAGLQLKDLPAENLSSHALWAACFFVAVALGMVLVFLRRTVRVMTLARPTADDLVIREKKSKVEEFQNQGKKQIRDPLIESLYERKSYVFGESDSIEELYADDYAGARRALKKLNAGEPAEWKREPVAPSPDNIKKLEAAIERSQKQFPILESVAHLELTRYEYRRLVKWLPLFGLLFALAICGFEIAIRSAPPPGAAISVPTNVRIVILDRTKAGLPPSCQETTLQGVAVGGTWDKPTVVTQDTPQCHSQLIEGGSGILAVPQVPAPPRPVP